VIIAVSTFLLLSGCGSEPAPAPPAEPAAAKAPDGPPGADGPEAIPVPEFEVSADPTVVARGARVFETRGCGACHQFGSRLVGPDLAGVTTRRTPKWIARQVLYPERMTREDPVAKQLFAELMVQMTNQRVDPSEIGPLVSFLATHP